MRRHALLVTLLLAPAFPARAVDVSLGAGAHYWFAERAIFDIDAILRAPLTRSVSIGARVGVALSATPVDIGIPLDALLRVDIDRLYFEVSGGAWIFIDGKRVAPHVAVGFGVQSGALTFGPEVGWLDPRAIIGGRLTYRF